MRHTTLLNYSLIDSSLNINIKIECNSKESKEILEKEKAQKVFDNKEYEILSQVEINFGITSPKYPAIAYKTSA